MAFQPNKIMIFGLPGSGKSTFDIQLGRLLGIPVEHLDHHFFLMGWVERDYNEFLLIQEKMAQQTAWIIDGNATRSFETRFKEADMALYFRYNRFFCIWRIFKRWLFESAIADSKEGYAKNVRWSLLCYLWGFNQRVEQSISRLRKKYPHVVFYELRSPQETREFIIRLKVNSSPSKH